MNAFTSGNPPPTGETPFECGNNCSGGMFIEHITIKESSEGNCKHSETFC